MIRRTNAHCADALLMMFEKKARDRRARPGVVIDASSNRIVSGQKHSSHSEFPLRQLLYEQIAKILSRRILDQSIRAGECLPNEYDLASEFHVSIGTIRKAVDILAGRNLVERVQGKGTYVSDRHIEILRRRLNSFRHADGSPVENWNIRELDYRLELAGALGIARLNLDAATEVHAIRRLRNVSRGPWISEEIFMPAAQFPDAGRSPAERRSLMLLLRNSGLLVGRIEELVRTAAAPPEEAARLSAKLDDPLLVIERTIFDEEGGLLEYRRSHCVLGAQTYWHAGDAA